MEYIDPALEDAVIKYQVGRVNRGTPAPIQLGRAADDGRTHSTKTDGCMASSIVVREVQKTFGDSRHAPQIGERVLQNNAPGEHTDLGFREVVLDLDTRTEPALNLRVQARIQVAPTEVAR